MGYQDQIKVLVVDDHEMVRYGLTLLLKTYPDIHIVGEVANPRTLIASCGDLKPDVILMDIMMPSMDGIAATKLVREAFPHIRVIALTGTADEKYICDMLQAGAISCISKSGSINEVINAIRAAYQGKSILSPEATNILLTKIHHPNKLGYNLSKQELKVLALLVEGLNNREIAERLVVSQSTVKAHVGHILAKLNANNRTQAIAITLQSQLLSQTN